MFWRGLNYIRKTYAGLEFGYERRGAFQNPTFTMRREVMQPSVKTVTPRDGYLLDIRFSNGESGVLDMKPYLAFGVFKRIKDCCSFEKVAVVFDTIEWESGVDLDPEFVYDKCKRS